jgi:hypothetical protein
VVQQHVEPVAGQTGGDEVGLAVAIEIRGGRPNAPDDVVRLDEVRGTIAEHHRRIGGNVEVPIPVAVAVDVGRGHRGRRPGARG